MLKHKIRFETECLDCIHEKTCNLELFQSCMNYHYYPNPTKGGCLECRHRYDRFENKVPCFRCKFYNSILDV